MRLRFAFFSENRGIDCLKEEAPTWRLVEYFQSYFQM